MYKPLLLTAFGLPFSLIQFQLSGKELSNLLLKKGILSKETHETVIRFAPPLVITKNEIDWAINIIKETLKNILS